MSVIYDPEYQIFIDCMKDYRMRSNMTQQELADLVGVSRQTIMQLERNRYNPSMLLAYSIARVFDVTIEDLFDFRENE